VLSSHVKIEANETLDIEMYHRSLHVPSLSSEGIHEVLDDVMCDYSLTFKQSNIKKIMLELNGKPSSVTTFSNDFSFQNLVFWNLFEFSSAKII
jgi:rRNA maturation endonuclease Nob1